MKGCSTLVGNAAKYEFSFGVVAGAGGDLHVTTSIIKESHPNELAFLTGDAYHQEGGQESQALGEDNLQGEWGVVGRRLESRQKAKSTGLTNQ